LIHLAVPGTWTGEGCFLTRQARRLELRAMACTTMMHLPLAAMEQMGAQTPEAVRCFAQILMMTVDVLIRVIHDLQKSDAASRIASVLQRAAGDHERPVRLSQAELGAMANASRKQVNAVLRQFSAAGWVSHGYRAIVVLNATALGEFAQQGAFPVAAAPTGDAATGTA
jgi:CRP-like cAMP-binding protein